MTSAAAVLLLTGCGPTEEPGTSRSLEGAWLLTRVTYPGGLTTDYPRNGFMHCLIFSNDTIYECQMKTLRPDDDEKLLTASDVKVVPDSKSGYTFFDKGVDDVLFLIDGNPCPLTLSSDTTLTYQRMGVRYSLLRATGMSSSRQAELLKIVESDLQQSEELRNNTYVLSTTERELRADNHRLTYIIIGMAAFITLVATVGMHYYRRSRRIAQQLKQLRQIEQEREQRPQPMRKAMKEVEEAFLDSDYYRTLKRHIAAGEQLKLSDWDMVEQRLNSVYPGFSSHLYSLYQLSPLEYQVCLLIKLRVAPSEIGTVLNRDVSTISSIRSRLYQKVFQRKGSSKEWDEFILSL